MSRSGYPKYIAAAATTQVATGRCVLKRIIIGETAAGVITVYDATSGSSADDIRAVLKASIAEGSYDFDMELKNGCRIITAGASKITVVVS